MRMAMSYSLPQAISKYPTYREHDWCISVENLIEELIVNADPINSVMDIIDQRYNRIMSSDQLLSLGSDMVKTMSFLQHVLRYIIKDAKETFNIINDERLQLRVIIDDAEAELGIKLYETDYDKPRSKY